MKGIRLTKVREGNWVHITVKVGMSILWIWLLLLLKERLVLEDM
ncbi:hypothetical protein EDD72_10397 [Tepidibacillus fermentans]|uniref:Uncharacterized protein n=1 Tax=Tepidibacillus fermentans TaxID=1281767 RepID=A0A4V2UT26_9BACI|nr:hypothetical protein EDD72_10397 [Tepidibacillus fermentans]